MRGTGSAAFEENSHDWRKRGEIASGGQMNEISKSIDAVIRDGLAKALKSDGYKKAARTFHRIEEKCIKVVNVQASQGNIGSEGKFTINLGVYLPLIESWLERIKPSTGLPKEYECTTRSRIGSLMPDQQDFWWPVNPQTNLAGLALEVRKAWETYGKPWLNQPWNDQRTAADLLERHGNCIEATAAFLLLGETTRAKKVVQEAAAWYQANDNANRANWIRESARDLGLNVDG
jgi:hypothetical protein